MSHQASRRRRFSERPHNLRERAPMERPGPYELWRQAGGDRELYLQLMRQHGHIVPGKRPAGEDVFGHPIREEGLR